MESSKHGPITKFYRDEAPKELCNKIAKSDSDDILAEHYPYKTALKSKAYSEHMDKLQLQLVLLQKDLIKTGRKIVVVMEGRDAAGKGGTIKSISEHLNPRQAHVIALGTASGVEKTQWYFQRYISRLPSAGEMVIYDRSWYNRGIVEKVFDFCTEDQRDKFFDQLPHFEKMFKSEGVTFVKIWLEVSRVEQLRRFLSREQDPLKQWKLSDIDIAGLSKWSEYTSAIFETLTLSHIKEAPWTVILSDDKKRARIVTIQTILSAIDFEDKDLEAIGEIDDQLVGGPERLYKE